MIHCCYARLGILYWTIAIGLPKMHVCEASLVTMVNFVCENYVVKKKKIIILCGSSMHSFNIKKNS